MNDKKYTLREKKLILSSLDDEVGKFHPLLQYILPALPNVKNVIYNHGTNESGADFIIEIENKIFNDLEYVGIIVKKGKIGSSIHKISEQIEECDLSRYILCGKKNIHLSEIWVITNESVTQQAKERIYDKYRSRKIRFVDNCHLISIIDHNIDNFWNANDIKNATYSNILANKTRHTDISYFKLKSLTFAMQQFENLDAIGSRLLLLELSRSGKDIIEFIDSDMVKEQKLKQYIYVLNRIGAGVNHGALDKEVIFSLWSKNWFQNLWNIFKPLVLRESSERRRVMYDEFRKIAE